MSTISKCKHCGGTEYQVRMLYVGYSQRVLLVECGECRQDLIPVVADRLMPDAEVYETCAAAWNTANTP